MDQFKEDQLAMCGRVVDYLSENEASLQVSEVASGQAADVARQFGQVAGARGGTARRTAKLTEDARQARVVLLDLLPALTGPLSRVATRLKDDDLKASVTLSSKQLRKLRPLAFVAVVSSVLGSAARPDVAPELARQGLTDKTLKPLVQARDAFQAAQPAARKTINERVLSGAALEDLVSALMDELRELDEDMKAFKLLDRPLYDGYVQVRKILDSGGGGGKKGEKSA